MRIHFVVGTFSVRSSSSKHRSQTATLVTQPPLLLKDKMKEQKVLFLASNPADTAQLNLLSEQKGIEKGLGQATHREAFDFSHVWATTPKEMHVTSPKVLLHDV